MVATWRPSLITLQSHADNGHARGVTTCLCTPTLLLNENVLKEGNAGQMNSLLIYYYTVSNAIFILHRMCAMCNAAFVLHF